MQHRTKNMTLAIAVTGALVLIACGSAPTDAPPSGTTSSQVNVQVTLTDFEIKSNLTDFKVGVPYHFVITNEGTVPHELLIMPPAEGAIGAEEANQMSLAGVDSEGVQPGDTATFDYTFQNPASAGTLEFACHLPGHYEAGMHLDIRVE